MEFYCERERERGWRSMSRWMSLLVFSFSLFLTARVFTLCCSRTSFTSFTSSTPHHLAIFFLSFSLSSSSVFHHLFSNNIPVFISPLTLSNPATTTMDPNLTSTPGTPAGGQIHFVTPTNRWLGSIPLSTLDPLTLEPLSTYVRPDPPRQSQGGNEKGGGDEAEEVEGEDMKERTTNIAGKYKVLSIFFFLTLCYNFFFSRM